MVQYLKANTITINVTALANSPTLMVVNSKAPTPIISVKALANTSILKASKSILVITLKEKNKARDNYY